MGVKGLKPLVLQGCQGGSEGPLIPRASGVPDGGKGLNNRGGGEGVPNQKYMEDLAIEDSRKAPHLHQHSSVCGPRQHRKPQTLNATQQHVFSLEACGSHLCQLFIGLYSFLDWRLGFRGCTEGLVFRVPADWQSLGSKKGQGLVVCVFLIFFSGV